MRATESMLQGHPELQCAALPSTWRSTLDNIESAYKALHNTECMQSVLSLVFSTLYATCSYYPVLYMQRVLIIIQCIIYEVWHAISPPLLISRTHAPTGPALEGLVRPPPCHTLGGLQGLPPRQRHTSAGALRRACPLCHQRSVTTLRMRIRLKFVLGFWDENTVTGEPALSPP